MVLTDINWRKRKMEKEKDIWRRKIYFFGGKKKLKRKRRKIVGDGKYILLFAGNNLNLYVSYLYHSS